MRDCELECCACRTNANLSADCGLYVSPCMYGGDIIRTVLPVEGLSYTSIPTEDFMDISNSVDDDIVSFPFLSSTTLYASIC